MASFSLTYAISGKESVRRIFLPGAMVCEYSRRLASMFSDNPASGSPLMEKSGQEKPSVFHAMER
jgi:hypothetical protein